MNAALVRSVWVGGLVGLVDALLGWSSAGLALNHLVGGLVVVALHQALAMALTVLAWLVVPNLGASAADAAATWRRHAAGGDVEPGAAYRWLIFACFALLGWGGAAFALQHFDGAFATELYVYIVQVAAVTMVGGLAALLAWRCASWTQSWTWPAGVSRWRVLKVALTLGLLLYGYLWFQRDLLFKDIHPGLLLLLLGHGVGLVWASVPQPRRRG